MVETLMAENILFRLKGYQFNQNHDLEATKLRREFTMRSVLVSSRVLVWGEEDGGWIIVDFEKAKTYSAKKTDNEVHSQPTYWTVLGIPPWFLSVVWTKSLSQLSRRQRPKWMQPNDTR